MARSEGEREEAQAVAEGVSEDERLPNEIEAMMVPTDDSAAQPVRPERSETTPVFSTQKVAKPAAAATKPLPVIGANTVPSKEIDNDQSEMSGDAGSGIDAAEIMPYLGFLGIVVGLAGLLGFINLRRRRRA